MRICLGCFVRFELFFRCALCALDWIMSLHLSMQFVVYLFSSCFGGILYSFVWISYPRGYDSHSGPLAFTPLPRTLRLQISLRCSALVALLWKTSTCTELQIIDYVDRLPFIHLCHKGVSRPKSNGSVSMRARTVPCLRTFSLGADCYLLPHCIPYAKIRSWA